MTVEIRPFDSLGQFEIDWLKARHHFSFGQYHDPARMGVGPLRVWNDDRVAPGSGFDPHPHRDMEIITYVRRGAVTHRDNLGNEGRTAAGDVQVMSAGTGIVHAEYNQDDEPLELFQIWIQPRSRGLAPRWAQRQFPSGERAGALVTLASGREGDSGALPIDQDAALLGATLTAGQRVEHTLGLGRQAYLVAARGRITVNGKQAQPRDGIVVRGEGTVAIEALDDAELLLADLP
jgi:quercetin 2,3-dioxygenase